MHTFIGLDPGGKNNFGWAVIEVVEADSTISTLRSGTGSDVIEVMAAITESPCTAPLGAGIDAPLYWSRSKVERKADCNIRKAVIKAGKHGAIVGHVNSLKGACLAQGILAAVAIAERWPTIAITESHPKALAAVKPIILRQFKRFNFPTEHERDAALGAYSALSQWRKDSDWSNLIEHESHPFFPSGSPVSYWFPKI